MFYSDQLWVQVANTMSIQNLRCLRSAPYRCARSRFPEFHVVLRPPGYVLCLRAFGRDTLQQYADHMAHDAQAQSDATVHETEFQ
jgi:hypothetical protein